MTYLFGLVHSVELKDNLLDLHRDNGVVCSSRLCMEPRVITHSDPFTLTKREMGRTQGRRGSEKGGVLDGGEDLEVGEGGDDAEEDYCFYW